MKSSSLCPTKLGRGTSPKIPEERICCSMERGGCTLAMCWNGNRFTEKKRCGIKRGEMWDDGRTRMEKRTRREAT